MPFFESILFIQWTQVTNTLFSCDEELGERGEKYLMREWREEKSDDDDEKCDGQEKRSKWRRKSVTRG